MNSLLGDLKDLPSAAKRAKTSASNARDMGKDPYAVLAGRFVEIRKELNEKMASRSSGSAVEIEARLGILVAKDTGGRIGPFTPGAGAIELLPGDMSNKRFVSGVSKKHFQEYEHFFTDSVKAGGSAVKSVKRTYTYGDGRRIEVNESGEVVNEVKTRELEFQLHLPACPYDLRVSVSIEAPVNGAAGGGGGQRAPEAGWESCRVKERTSFLGTRTTAGRPGHWQADLTRVVTETRGGGSATTYEVELELGGGATQGWVGAAEAERAKEQTKLLAWELWDRVSHLMPAEKTASVLSEIRDAALLREAKKAALLPFGGGGERADFPGTMPVGFSRRALRQVMAEDYYVSEKTDGVRYFLVVVEGEGGAKGVLLDRKFNGYSAPGIDEAAAGLGPGTVLDGEVVWNRSWKRDVFMVFDGMACSAQCHASGKWASIVDDPLCRRLACIQKDILGGYLRGIPGHEVKRDMAALPLIMKSFYKAGEIGDVLRNIASEGPDRVFLERDKRTGAPLPALKRHHKSDGLIFAPNAPYRRGTDPRYLKWKWPDSITLDFSVTRCREAPDSHVPGIQVSFPAAGTDAVDFTEHVRLGEHERYRLLGDLAAAEGSGGLVAEWEYDPEDGCFRYKIPRPDKKKANFSRTVLATLMELAEGLDVEEVQYRLGRRGKEDDWAARLAKFRADLVRPPPA